MNDDIDTALLDQVIRLGRFSSPGVAINAALADYLRCLKRRALLELKGQVPWEADLDALRAGDPTNHAERPSTRPRYPAQPDEFVALSKAATSLDQLLAAAGISEEDLVDEFLQRRTRKPE